MMVWLVRKNLYFYLKMGLSMRENGSKGLKLEMEEEFKFGQMGLDTRVSGEIIEPVDRVDSFMPMGIYMMVNGLKIKPKDLENINILTVLNTKVIGEKINKTGMVKRFGLMVLNLKDSTKREKRKVEEILLGQMDLTMLEIFMIIIFMEKEYTGGLMEEFSMALGKIIKCMVMVCSLGLMEESMKESTLKIKNKDKVPFNGLMEGSILVGG